MKWARYTRRNEDNGATKTTWGMWEAYTWMFRRVVGWEMTDDVRTRDKAYIVSCMFYNP